MPGQVRMMEADAEAALFSLKSCAAAVIAYYLALRMGLSQPVWALNTVLLVSQPLAGQVFSEALFRMMGTLLGGIAAVVFLPGFVNEPLILSVVLALWLGLCVHLVLLDRTPRSHMFVLAGYTASIIGFPSVLTQGSIFDTAVVRVQEIGIGILTATLVPVVFSITIRRFGRSTSRTLTNRLQQRIVATVSGVEQVSRRALAGTQDPILDGERRRLASSVNNIEQLACHLPFDITRLLPRAAAIRALQDRVSRLLPLSGSVEDRIVELRAQEGGVPTEVAGLIGRVESWFAESISGSAREATARELVAEAERIEQEITARESWRWRDTLLLSRLARLAELVLAHRVLRELLDRIPSGSVHGLSPEAARLVDSASGRSLHRDHTVALRSALGATVAVFAVCAFWMATAWPSAAIA